MATQDFLFWLPRISFECLGSAQDSPKTEKLLVKNPGQKRHSALDDHAVPDGKSCNERKHDSSEIYFSKTSDACSESINSSERIDPSSEALC